ncbi:MAG: hypothetical protein AAF799_29780 [Myxococcota bacterium]
MKHALIVGVPERAISGELQPEAGSGAIAALLQDLGGWTLTLCTGPDATRSRVLAALTAMVSACQPGDACLFYFFGHGGAVKFSGLRGDLGQRVVFYLATLRPQGSRQRVGLLDIELSDGLTRLDHTCRNVTAIIDCCHAAATVRDDWVPTVAPPAWVTELDDQYHEQTAPPLLLATEGHPRIVRLFGSSALRHAYADETTAGLYGLLTRSFVETVREAGLRCDRVTWDTVAHRAREQASRHRGTEEQRVVLAGPRHRLLLSTAAAPVPYSAAFIPASTPGRGWIRAGMLQGVHTGDRWGIAALELHADGRHRFEAEAEVVRVDLDSSEVVLSNATARPVAGASAIVQRLDRRIPVTVHDDRELHATLETSGLVRPIAPTEDARIASLQPTANSSTTLDVFDDRGRPLWLDFPDEHATRPELITLLEDRARARRLLDSLATASPHAATSTDVTWSWGVLGPDGEAISLPSTLPTGASLPRVRAGSRLWIALEHRGTTPRQWFASVLELSVEGRLNLLNTHEPEGMELRPGARRYVGRRAHRRRQGLTCRWPARVPKDHPRAQQLLILASRRPIAMGHLITPPSPDDPTAFAAQGLNLAVPSPNRGAMHRPFTVSEQWTMGRIDFELDPRP